MKNYMYVILIAFFIISCGSSKKVARKSTKKRSVSTVKKKVSKVNNKTVTIADKVIWSAFKYKGTRYKYAGISKSGMDCSGLVYTSFKERNIVLPRSSSLLYKEGYNIPLNKAKRGDLLFFKTTNKSRSKINHVAIVTSVNNGIVKFIHSTTSRGVIESSMLQDYWRKAFVQAKRVL